MEDNHNRHEHQRKVTAWTISSYIIAYTMTPGVLSVAASMAVLGWGVGLVGSIGVASVTIYTALLLADCYSSHPHPLSANSSSTYMVVVRTRLGGGQAWVCGIAQLIDLLRLLIFTIQNGTISMFVITRSDCFYSVGLNGNANYHYRYSSIPYMILFGVIQVVVSHIPNFSWMSIVGTIMGCCYSCIAICLCIAKVSGYGKSRGTLGGVLWMDHISNKDKMWSIIRELGFIANLYSYSTLLLEIQNEFYSTLVGSNTITYLSSEIKTSLKKATISGASTATLFYILVGCTGYAAFGADAPSNLLDGFGLFNPYWPVKISNACLVLQTIFIYQELSRPIFTIVEKRAMTSYPNFGLCNREHKYAIGRICTLHINYFHLIWRTCFVVVMIVVSMMIQIFSDILQLFDSLAFWLTTFYFPIMIYISKAKVQHWSSKWITLLLLNILSFCFTCLVLFESFAHSPFSNEGYKPFLIEYYL